MAGLCFWQSSFQAFTTKGFGYCSRRRSAAKSRRLSQLDVGRGYLRESYLWLVFY